MRKKYTYPLQASSIVKNYFLALFYPIQVVLGFLIIKQIFLIFQEPGIIDSLKIIGLVLVMSILMFVLTFPITNSEIPVIVSSKGIKVRYFIYFSYWKFINWNQIGEIHESTLPLLNYRKCVFIQTDKAPAITIILGLLVIKQFKTGFIITCKIREFSDLINKIESNVEQ